MFKVLRLLFGPNTGDCLSSHGSFPIINTVCFKNPKLNPNNLYTMYLKNRGFRNTFDCTTLSLCVQFITVHIGHKYTLVSICDIIGTTKVKGR